MIDHPMQPSPEQFSEWMAEACRLHQSDRTGDIAVHIARLAYAAGADEELEACCSSLFHRYGHDRHAVSLRADRRPKPPSLKQQGRNALSLIKSGQWSRSNMKPFDVLSRVIEALPDEL